MMDKIDFIEKPNYNKEDIKYVQSVLLEMAKLTANILDDAGVKYFLGFGSLLGAVRHQGFIPWDDDFDFFIIDEDYDRALVSLEGNLPDWMIIHNEKTDPIYWPCWTKLRDKYTVANADLWKDDNNYLYRGVNVDLYRMLPMKKSMFEQYTKEENLRFYEKKHKSGLVDNDKYIKETNRLKQELSDLRTNKIQCEGEDGYAFIGQTGFIEKDRIFPLKTMKFENIEFFVPNDEDYLLKRWYGEYMKLPELKDRKSHYDNVEIIKRHNFNEQKHLSIKQHINVSF